ncbi:nucleotidyl transferase AbiEii/AbiGii toxin family protein [Kitasatospora sp. MY 5-36]|uniref:nucleotidyl transferase AbiEii/AbiGii toxin family protein n=1 Tax=Kitasatospora sp. MY 5-36 TaxID=1678027 RepID=UPI0006708100|nr:nucleotidyl transferase AbiEii/AbiGii toxin family protein [Kitasatospora sp. MY 5-36]
MHDHETTGPTEAGGRTPARKPSPAPPTRLLGLQATVGNAAVVQMLRQAGRSQTGHSQARPEQHRHTVGHVPARPPAAVQRAEGGSDTDAESEFRLGVAATLERVINDDVKDRLGVSGLHLSIGGGGGVAALKAARPVQDLDLRLHISDPEGQDPELRREVITYLEALLQDEAGTDPNGTTVKGTFGGAEVSITLGKVPTETRNMQVHESSARVPLTVVAPLRLFTDKVTAFAMRKEKEGEVLAEKRQRDARDLLTLYSQITSEGELADVLAENADNDELIHHGLKKAAQFTQELGRYRKDHTGDFEPAEWERLREIGRTLERVAKNLRKPKAEPPAQPAQPASPSGTTPAAVDAPAGTDSGAMTKADRKAAKQARRQQKLIERPPTD